MPEKDLDWLGDPRWRGYPRREPAGVRDGAAQSSAPQTQTDPRQSELAKENETLRARAGEFARLCAEFDRRLADAGSAYEGALLRAECQLRDAQLECKSLSGELKTAKDEAARLTARESARDADLRLERERRADAEKALAEARRRLEELASESERLRAEASQRAGTLEELRRQAGLRNDLLLQAKALTDQDVALLRQEMGDFLAKFHRINESLEEQQ